MSDTTQTEAKPLDGTIRNMLETFFETTRNAMGELAGSSGRMARPTVGGIYPHSMPAPPDFDSLPFHMLCVAEGYVANLRKTVPDIETYVHALAESRLESDGGGKEVTYTLFMKSCGFDKPSLNQAIAFLLWPGYLVRVKITHLKECERCRVEGHVPDGTFSESSMMEAFTNAVRKRHHPGSH